MNSHTPISAMKGPDGTRIRGQYRVTYQSRGLLDSGKPYLRLNLADASGMIPAFAIPYPGKSGMVPTIRDVVEIEARLWRCQGTLILIMQTVKVVPPEKVRHGAWMLPRNLCPPSAWKALGTLIAMEETTVSPLQDFLRRVLADPDIFQPLLRCRASVNQHHADPGGLLVHNTAMMNQAAELTRRLLPENRCAPDMVRVACLLHDIGKIRTVGEKDSPVQATSEPYETDNLRALAKHLDWLCQVSPRLGAVLRYIFEYLATPMGQRAPARYQVAAIVANMTRWSAEIQQSRMISCLPKMTQKAPLVEPLPSQSGNHGAKFWGQHHAP